MNSIKKYPFNAKWFTEELINWSLKGSPLPAPHYIKVLHLDQLIQVSKYREFIETGTLMGDTSGIIGLAHPDTKVSTIEISEHYYKESSKRLSALSNINLYLGDSSSMLPLILEKLQGPAIFWLDAHFSGGLTGKGDSNCPVSEELEAIRSHPLAFKHVLVFDDIRDFKGNSGYPLLSEFQVVLSGLFPESEQYTRHDSLVLGPKEIIKTMIESPPLLDSLSVVEN